MPATARQIEATSQVDEIARACAERANRLSWRLSRMEPLDGFESRPEHWRKSAESLIAYVDELGYRLIRNDDKR